MSWRTLRLRINEGELGSELAEHPVIRAVGGKSRMLERSETFFDTADLMLCRRGMLLTARRQGVHWVGGVWSYVGEEASKEWECGEGEGVPDWTDLKKHLPEGSLEGIKVKNLEKLFEMRRQEERWRLDFPDGTRMVVREVRWEVVEGEEGLFWREVVLEYFGGNPNRFFQTVLSLGRHVGGVLEPLNPASRMCVGRDSTIMKLTVWKGSVFSAGEGAFKALSGAGESLLQLMLDQLAPLRYGPSEVSLEAMGQLGWAVDKMRALIGLFHTLLPEKLRHDMTMELEWLAGELEPVRAWNGVLGNVLVPMEGRFSGHQEVLGGVMEQARQQQQGACEQVMRAISTFRFTQLVLGFASWLIGEEGLKISLLESDPLLRERLSASSEGVIREGLSRSHKVLSDLGRKYWRKSPGSGDVGDMLADVEVLSHGLTLFSGVFADKKVPRYQESVAELGRELRVLKRLADEERLWHGLSLGQDEKVLHLFLGWQGARMEQGLMNCKRAWEVFEQSPVPFS
ncbi:MAG: CHAD domain-containing protein [Magnetococcus sp. YQC-5]